MPFPRRSSDWCTSAEGVVCTIRQLGSCVAERLIFLAGSSGANLGLLSIAKVRMVGDVNIYVLDIAVDMIAVGIVVLYGVPDNLSNCRVVIGAEQSLDVSDIGGGLVGFAIFDQSALVKKPRSDGTIR